MSSFPCKCISNSDIFLFFVFLFALLVHVWLRSVKCVISLFVNHFDFLSLDIWVLFIARHWNHYRCSIKQIDKADNDQLQSESSSPIRQDHWRIDRLLKIKPFLRIHQISKCFCNIDDSSSNCNWNTCQHGINVGGPNVIRAMCMNLITIGFLRLTISRFIVHIMMILISRATVTTENNRMLMNIENCKLFTNSYKFIARYSTWSM